MNNNILFVDKYAPQTFDEYIWRDHDLRLKAEQWIKDGALPHLLFHGNSGVGKTSLIRLLLKTLNIPSGDILFIGASGQRHVNNIQDKIAEFSTTWAINDTGFKYVILDEADSLSAASQNFLRCEIENNSDTTRFLLTANYPNKILPHIRGRCQEREFTSLPEEEFITRLYNILQNECIEFENDDLFEIIKNTYPNFRKCLNELENNIVDGVLKAPKIQNMKEYLLQSIELFIDRKFSQARKLIIENTSSDDYSSVYRFLYENLDLWGETEDQKDDALLIIRKGLVNHSLVIDPEINLSATLCELIRNIKKSDS